MMIKELPLQGLLLFEPKVFNDERGYFFESYNSVIKNAIGEYDFVQDNESFSKKNVLRGMHFQNPPFEQGKLVRVVSGRVSDVVIDIRKNSSTYGQWFEIELNSELKQMLWIPPGFAHGFLTLTDNTTFLYKCTKVYNAQSESGVIWNDSLIEINWKTNTPLVSEKDLKLPSLKDLISPF